MEDDEVLILPKQSIAFELKSFTERLELLYFFTWRNFRVRYKQTLIGAAWAVFRPFMLMVVFTVAFNRVASVESGSSEIPYPIFAYSGLLFWSYFSQTVTQVGGSLLTYQGIIKKIYFPRLMVPLSTAATGLIDMFFATIIYVLLAAYYGIVPGLSGILLFLPLVLISFLTVLGVGLLAASLNVKYRDVGQALPFFIQSLLFLTPVIYPVESVPEKYQWILFLNPMAGVVDTSQASLLGLRAVQWDMLLISIASCFVMLFIGLVYFRAKEREMADLI